MGAFLIADLVIGAVGLLVVVFVAYPYRGRSMPRAPRRLTDRVAEVTERLDPGPAPVHGVLLDAERSRRMSRRFERVESLLRHPTRALQSVGRDRT